MGVGRDGGTGRVGVSGGDGCGWGAIHSGRAGRVVGGGTGRGGGTAAVPTGRGDGPSASFGGSVGGV